MRACMFAYSMHIPFGLLLTHRQLQGRLPVSRPCSPTTSMRLASTIASFAPAATSAPSSPWASPCGSPRSTRRPEAIPIGSTSMSATWRGVVVMFWRSTRSSRTSTRSRPALGIRRHRCWFLFWTFRVWVRNYIIMIYPDAPCMPHLPTLGWFGGQCRHIFHGVHGIYTYIIIYIYMYS